MTRRFPVRRLSHALTARQLQAHPGMWQRVGVYRSQQSAQSVAYVIRKAYRSVAYQPAGAYEARIQIHGDDTAVVARYIGTPKASTA